MSDWPEFMTGEQVAELLGLREHPEHVEALRRRAGLPYLRWLVRGTEEVIIYPRDHVREWAARRVKVNGQNRARGVAR